MVSDDGQKMSKLPDGHARPDALPAPGEEDAASWFVRARGTMSEAEQRDFIAWLATHPRHARDYDAVSAAWNACLDLCEDRDLLDMRLKAGATVSGTKHRSGEGK